MGSGRGISSVASAAVLIHAIPNNQEKGPTNTSAPFFTSQPNLSEPAPFNWYPIRVIARDHS